MKGLVLSGGGSKGAYEIGVYKALRKLKKTPDIVTGTSVGAINGVFVVQNDVRAAMKVWNNMSFSVIYDEDSFDSCNKDNMAEIYAKYVKSFVTEGGMDVTKLKKLFDKLYNPKKFFKSKINYGLVTYNLTKNKPVHITKKDLTPNNVKDYVIASASCYPAFKPYKINEELYIDGGYYDNLPINLAIKMGATDIIAVDLRAVGLKREINSNANIITISPRNKISSFLVFEKAKSREAMHFGYNDTMKTFKKLDGNILTFKKGNLIKNYNKYINAYENNMSKIFQTNNEITKKLFESLLKESMEKNISYHKFNNIVEKAGICFGFPEDVIYNIKTYNKGLLKAISETETTQIKTKEDIRKIMDKKQIVKYFYALIKACDFNALTKIVSLMSDEFLIALYIYTVDQVHGYY